MKLTKSDTVIVDSLITYEEYDPKLLSTKALKVYDEMRKQDKTIQKLRRKKAVK